MAKTKSAEGKKVRTASSEGTARVQNDTVGELLRVARVNRDLSLETVAGALNLRAGQLRAIEENNLDALPGMTYAIGFVRGYANYLGLDSVEIVHRFRVEHGHTPSPSKLAFPEPVVESRTPDMLMVGVGAFLAVVVLIVWTLFSGGDKAAEKVAEQTTAAPVEAAAPAAPEQTPPATPVAEATTPATPEATATAAPVATEQTAQPAAAETPKVEEAAKPAEEKPAAVAATEEKPAQTAEEKKAADDATIKVKKGKSRITLRASQASWVQISDAKDGVIYRKVLRPGDQYFVPDQPGLSLVTANAGGLDVVVDGREVQSIGKPGEIVRGVSLDANELKKMKTKVRD